MKPDDTGDYEPFNGTKPKAAAGIDPQLILALVQAIIMLIDWFTSHRAARIVYGRGKIDALKQWRDAISPDQITLGQVVACRNIMEK